MPKRILVCCIHNLSSKTFMLPSGPAFISAVLKRNAFDVTNFVWDLAKGSEQNIISLRNAIIAGSIDIVMCGAMVNQLQNLKRIFETAKGVSQNIVTIQGGALVTYSPIEAMKLIPECDIGIIGEGELTVCELMKHIEYDTPIGGCRGIILRDDALGYIMTECRDEPPDLAMQPIPDYEGFFGDWLNGHEAFLVTSGRGCNHACTFCTAEKRYRERPLEKLLEELDFYIDKYDIKMLSICNEYVNTESSYIDAFCGKLRKYQIPFRIMTRISKNLSPDILSKLKDAGLTEFNFGLESADDSVLKSMKKGLNSEIMLEVLTNVKEAQIDVYGFFIFGDTVESRETVERTLTFAKKHRNLIQGVGLIPLYLYPGSFLYDKAVMDGKIEPLTHIRNNCPPVNISRLSDDEYNYYKNTYFNYFHYNELMTDLSIKDVSFKKANDTVYDFRFACEFCGFIHEKTVDLHKTVYRNTKFFCKCGEKIALDFWSHLIDKARMREFIKNNRVAFYGIGGVFYKCYFKCELSKFTSEYFLLDRMAKNPFKMGESSLQIHPPEKIAELGVQKVIVTISGLYSLDSILSNLRESYPHTEFIMWCEI